jgi:hypothetical protein
MWASCPCRQRNTEREREREREREIARNKTFSVVAAYGSIIVYACNMCLPCLLVAHYTVHIFFRV